MYLANWASSLRDRRSLSTLVCSDVEIDTDVALDLTQKESYCLYRFVQ